MSSNAIHKWIIAGSLLFVLSVSINPVWAFKVKSCTPPAEDSIKEAHNFVTNNLNGIVAQMTWRNLTDKHRNKFKRKWGRLKARCADNRKLCVKNSDIYGFAHGGIGNTVNICYFNLVDLKSTFCDLVGALVHEKAHADGMPKGKHHSDRGYPEAKKDTVYRMGDTASEYCISKKTGSKDYMLKGRTGLVYGKQCAKDDQCLSGRCGNFRYTCLCRKDSDCRDGKTCNRVTGRC